QTLLFSATLPQEITQLATDLLIDPVRIDVSPTSTVADNIEQQVLFVEKANKRALLADVLKEHGVQRAIVFTRTKHRANRVARDLVKSGISADAIHSNKSQGARQRALGDFDAGKVRVLVATDIVSRGIDVDDITHVINFEIPNEPEAYVHRIGRTARAGAEGVAMSFCEEEELSYIKAIERLTGIELTTADDHRFHSDRIATLHADGTVIPKRASGSGGSNGSGNGRSSGRSNGSDSRRSGSGRGNGRSGSSRSGNNGSGSARGNSQGGSGRPAAKANGQRDSSASGASRRGRSGRPGAEGTRQNGRPSSTEARPQATSAPSESKGNPEFGRGRRSAA
ncbi:MAG: DEAD/DEAH box helicase, partial [Gemmatimonadetes bacterium]|nr:DEAD/DEAH box helicase [Gemmatimonadota bacterium]